MTHQHLVHISHFMVLFRTGFLNTKIKTVLFYHIFEKRLKKSPDEKKLILKKFRSKN